MDAKLNVLLTMVGADRYNPELEYEPVTCELLAFKNHECVEHYNFECAIQDYKKLVTDYYYDCLSRGLKPSFYHARVAVL